METNNNINETVYLLKTLELDVFNNSNNPIIKELIKIEIVIE